VGLDIGYLVGYFFGETRFLDAASIFESTYKETYEDIEPEPFSYLNVLATTVRFDAPVRFETVLT
jgi:hypothetical protein